MARPVSAPSCAASHQHRGALWRRMLRINRAHRRLGGQGPITHAYARVFDWLLWKAPRSLGVLIPSMRTIRDGAGVSLATVKRALAALKAWKLLVVHGRTLVGPRPSLIAGRLYLRRERMTASNAYTFPPPDLPIMPPLRVAQTAHVGEAVVKQQANKRDAQGRWLPAVAVAMLNRVRRQMAQEEVVTPDPTDTLAVAQAEAYRRSREIESGNAEA